MELFQIKRCGPLEGTESLYVRVEHGSFDSQTGVMEKGTILSLDTYFNSFSCSKYLHWTLAESATAELICFGLFTTELWAYRNGKDELLERIEAKDRVEISFHFKDEEDHCRYWLRLFAKEQCCFQGGSYRIKVEAQPVRIALIICTYRREQYILGNLQKLFQDFDKHIGLQAEYEIFVVDNGNTLSQILSNREGLWIFPNKNIGGSGGFTRGLMEVLQRKNDFTHVLFMDDDVVLDPNVLWKTAQFLKILRPQYQELHLAGGMLDLNSPVLQYEATARWKGGEIRSLKHRLSLNKRRSLLQNERQEQASYGAWWYLCLPLSLVEKDNLPLPFFIKGDDVEYGLRNTGFITTLNGIGIWHKGFESKYAPWVDYYLARNSMVISAIYPQNGNHIVPLLWKKSLSYLAMGIPQAQVFLEMAIEDFAKGTDFFLQTDMEALHQKLCKLLPNQIDMVPKPRRILWLCGKVLTTTFWRGLAQTVFLTVKYQKIRASTEEQYQARWRELISWKQWEYILDISYHQDKKGEETV